MSSHFPPIPPGPPDPPPQPSDSSGGSPHAPNPVVSQTVNYSHVSARVGDRAARGTFATNALVLSGPQEIVFDFLLRLVPPAQVAARVVMPWSSIHSVVNALQENVNTFRARFPSAGTLPPPPPNVTPPNIQEIYDQLKISEEVAVGAYANTLMVTHSATEFCFDFILDVFPRATVSSRIYMAAPQVPPFLEAIKRTLQQLQAMHQQAMQRPQPPPPPPPESGPERSKPE